MGLSVECFSSAGEFLEFLESFDGTGPVCLIADIQMPDVNGIEMLQRLNAMGHQFSTIMITGHGTAELQKKAESLGAAAFLEKPFHPKKLQENITSCLKLNRAEKETQ